MTNAKKGDASKILNDAVSLNCRDAEVQLCLASLSEDEIPIFQNVVISTSVADDFRTIAEAVLSKISRQLEDKDLELHGHVAGTKLDEHQIEYLDLAEHKVIADQIAALATPNDIEDFDATDDFIKSLRFYVIIVSPKKGKPVRFFRSYSPKKELSRSLLFAITMKKGQYDKVIQTQFMFDPYIDCFAVGNLMFILNKGRFERIFQFYELLEKTAEAVLATIEKHIPIDNFEDFKKVCRGHIQKLAKLKNISDKPYLQDLTLDKIKLAVEEFDLPIETTGTGKNEKLHFDPSQPWAILKLLDDDYLGSIMTGNRYEVNSKRTI